MWKYFAVIATGSLTDVHEAPNSANLGISWLIVSNNIFIPLAARHYKRVKSETKKQYITDTIAYSYRYSTVLYN